MTDVDLEISRIEAMINSPQMRDMRDRARHSAQHGGKAIRPRNAASIIVLDGPPGRERIVMGKRNRKLKFMPGALVFPGGSVDRGDGYVAVSDELDHQTEEKLLANLRGRPVRQTARALGVAAVRELAEETGLLLGETAQRLPAGSDWQEFADRGLAPEIGSLRLLSRAITPPGLPRRFDTWFFVTRLSDNHVAPVEGFRPSGELEELQWLTPAEAMRAETREITRVMLVELMRRLAADPELDPATPAPFYATNRGRFFRELM